MTVEKINMTKLIHGHTTEEDHLEHFLTHVATKSDGDIFNNLAKDENGDVIFDVEMTIDGHSVSVQEWVNFIVKQFDHHVKQEALKLIQDHYSEQVFELGNIIEEKLTDIKFSLLGNSE